MQRVGAMVGVALVVATGCSGQTAESAAEQSIPLASTSTTVVTTTPPAPTTTELDPADRDPDCVVAVQQGDSLGVIAVRVDDVSLEQILDENHLAVDSVIHPGDELDICIGNDVDDVSGSSRLKPPEALVRTQQTKLNELFASYRLIPLVVDGDSGQLTRQMLCTARMGLGLPVSGGHLDPDSDEADVIMDADDFAIPDGAATWASKWILIDKTCQVMFIGEGDELVNIYPTSTGEPGFETFGGQSFTASRYDPAVETDGWHDSSSFPVEVDNPLNGNMYKPLYFNEGQAIHGANFVPPFPRSKGCARTFPLHQDELIRWIGLEELTEATWRAADIGVTVTVQGAFRPID